MNPFDLQTLRQRAAAKDYAGRSRTAYSGEDSLYDTASIAPGTAFPGSFSFFSQGLNNGKTYAQTNMQLGGQLSNNDAFLVLGVRFGWFSNANQIDVNFICNNTWLNWNFYNNSFFKGIPEMFPGGSMAYATAASSTALVTADVPYPITSILNGTPMKMNYFSVSEPGLLLCGNDSIAVELINAGGAYTTAAAAIGGTGLTMHVWLDGYRIRQTS